MPDDPKMLFVFYEAESLPPDFWDRVGEMLSLPADLVGSPGSCPYATYSNCTTPTPAVTVESLLALKASLPPPPKYPHPVRDAAGRLIGAIEDHDWLTGCYIVRVATDADARRLEAEATRQGYKVRAYAGDLSLLDLLTSPPPMSSTAPHLPASSDAADSAGPT